MSQRITSASQYGHALFDIGGSFSRLAHAQNRLSSTRRLSAVSDSPGDAARVLDLHVAAQRLTQLRNSVKSAREIADSQASLLQNASELLSQARSRALEATNGATSATDLKAIATDLDGMLDQLLAIANDHTDGRFTFAGSRVDSAPFRFTADAAGDATHITYAGDDVHRSVRFGRDDVRAVDLSGAEAFFRFERGPTVVTGNTGLASVANAADTMVGDARIVVAHTSTTWGNGLIFPPVGAGDSISGLLPALTSGSDTIVGSRRIVVTSNVPGPGGTLAFEGGASTPFTGSESDLVLDDGNGGILHVDVRSLTAGFNGTVTVVGSGTVAADGGAAQAITFAADQTITAKDGRVVHLDTRNVRLAGESLAVFPGTQSVFDELVALRDDIRGAAGFGSVGLAERVQSRVAGLVSSQDGILVAAGELGARSGAFQRADEALELNSITIEDNRGRLEDVDVAATTIEMTRAETAYQAALAVAARIGRTSLLDYI